MANTLEKLSKKLIDKHYKPSIKPLEKGATVKRFFIFFKTGLIFPLQKSRKIKSKHFD